MMKRNYDLKPRRYYFETTNMLKIFHIMKIRKGFKTSIWTCSAAQKGGFELQKWISIFKDLFETFPTEHLQFLKFLQMCDLSILLVITDGLFYYYVLQPSQSNHKYKKYVFFL